jgi:hypothetical protein
VKNIRQQVSDIPLYLGDLSQYLNKTQEFKKKRLNLIKTKKKRRKVFNFGAFDDI